MVQHLAQHLPQQLQDQLERQLPPYCLYMLPRALLVLAGWGATYWLLTAVSTRLPPAVVYLTGISWMLAGALGFGYLYRLRRAAQFAQGRCGGAEQQPR